MGLVDEADAALSSLAIAMRAYRCTGTPIPCWRRRSWVRPSVLPSPQVLRPMMQGRFAPSNRALPTSSSPALASCQPRSDFSMRCGRAVYGPHFWCRTVHFCEGPLKRYAVGDENFDVAGRNEVFGDVYGSRRRAQRVPF
jgi:hypothetical protein